MRFFEYESRAIVAKAGIPVTKHGFAKTADEAREIAEQIAGPVVIKSQVLTGGRMKAGGVQFADTPDEAAVHAEHVLELEINGHMPRGVLVDSTRRGQARVLRRRRLGRDPQAPGDAVLRHGRDRHRGGRRAASRPRRAAPLLDPAPVLGLAGQAGDRLPRDHRLGAEPPDPDPRPAGPAVPRVRHDARGDQPARRARGRRVRRARRPHGHGERGPPAPEGAAARSSASATRRRARRARRRRSSSPARRSTPRTTAAWPAT